MNKNAIDFIKLGLPIKDYFFFKNNKNYKLYNSKLFGNKIEMTHPFWFLHSLEEIFLDEVYKFTSEKKNPYIIDCGANIGLSILYFKRSFPDCKILGFEADKAIFDILSKNLKSFGIDNESIKIFNNAIWSSDTILDFSSEGSLGGSLSVLGINTNVSNKVNAVSLSKYLSEQYVDFLKIDIEGAEYEVIISCKESLQNVDKLFIEYHSLPNSKQMLPELLTCIKDAGFKIYIKEAWNNMSYPFINNKDSLYFDLQLNIFCYR